MIQAAENMGIAYVKAVPRCELHKQGAYHRFSNIQIELGILDQVSTLSLFAVEKRHKLPGLCAHGFWRLIVNIQMGTLLQQLLRLPQRASYWGRPG